MYEYMYTLVSQCVDMVCKHICIYIHTYKYVRKIHACTCTYTHVYTHIHAGPKSIEMVKSRLQQEVRPAYMAYQELSGQENGQNLTEYSSVEAALQVLRSLARTYACTCVYAQRLVILRRMGRREDR